MSEGEPRYTPEDIVENTVEFDEALAWERLATICRDLLPDLDEDEITYLAGLGVDIALITNQEGESIDAPREVHANDFNEALGEALTLAIQHGVEEEFNQKLEEADILQK